VAVNSTLNPTTSNNKQSFKWEKIEENLLKPTAAVLISLTIVTTTNEAQTNKNIIGRIIGVWMRSGCTGLFVNLRFFQILPSFLLYPF
jgi:hypothetical protein